MDMRDIRQYYSHGLFADRETIGEALKYAGDLIETLRPADRMVAYTAVYVVLNTALKVAESVELKEIA